jgi:unsaturated chondroitin disaccharide hydrolase
MVWGVTPLYTAHFDENKIFDTAKKIAHYFITCVCDDYLPKVDFRSPDDPVIIDSTAAGLAACGLIEIAKAVPEFEKKHYINAAIKILKATEAACANYDETEDALILRGSHSYKRENQREIPIVMPTFILLRHSLN